MLLYLIKECVVIKMANDTMKGDDSFYFWSFSIRTKYNLQTIWAKILVDERPVQKTMLKVEK